MADEGEHARRVVCGPGVRAALLADVAARPRIEACGVLIGEYKNDEWLIANAIPLRNIHNASDHFEFDPEELLERDLEWGESIVGAYHSHPDGSTRPSRIDIGNMEANAASPWIWLIVGPRHTGTHGLSPETTLRNVDVAAFRIEEGKLTEFPVHMVEGEMPTI